MDKVELEKRYPMEFEGNPIKFIDTFDQWDYLIKDQVACAANLGGNKVILFSREVWDVMSVQARKCMLTQCLWQANCDYAPATSKQYPVIDAFCIKKLGYRYYGEGLREIYKVLSDFLAKGDPELEEILAEILKSRVSDIHGFFLRKMMSFAQPMFIVTAMWYVYDEGQMEVERLYSLACHTNEDLLPGEVYI